MRPIQTCRVVGEAGARRARSRRATRRSGRARLRAPTVELDRARRRADGQAERIVQRARPPRVVERLLGAAEVALTRAQVRGQRRQLGVVAGFLRRRSPSSARRRSREALRRLQHVRVVGPEVARAARGRPRPRRGRGTARCQPAPRLARPAWASATASTRAASKRGHARPARVASSRAARAAASPAAWSPATGARSRARSARACAAARCGRPRSCSTSAPRGLDAAHQIADSRLSARASNALPGWPAPIEGVGGALPQQRPRRRGARRGAPLARAPAKASPARLQARAAAQCGATRAAPRPSNSRPRRGVRARPRRCSPAARRPGLGDQVVGEAALLQQLSACSSSRHGSTMSSGWRRSTARRPRRRSRRRPARRRARACSAGSPSCAKPALDSASSTAGTGRRSAPGAGAAAREREQGAHVSSTKRGLPPLWRDQRHAHSPNRTRQLERVEQADDAAPSRRATPRSRRCSRLGRGEPACKAVGISFRRTAKSQARRGALGVPARASRPSSEASSAWCRSSTIRATRPRPPTRRAQRRTPAAGAADRAAPPARPPGWAPGAPARAATQPSARARAFRGGPTMRARIAYGTLASPAWRTAAQHAGYVSTNSSRGATCRYPARRDQHDTPGSGAAASRALRMRGRPGVAAGAPRSAARGRAAAPSRGPLDRRHQRARLAIRGGAELVAFSASQRS